MLNVLKVCMPIAVWQKMTTYVDICDTEVSGFGFVDGQFLPQTAIITDVFILKQKVTGAEAVIDSGAYLKFMSDLGDENETRAAAGKPPKLARFQWHSHVNMPPKPSQADYDTIEGCLSEWRISMIVNKFKKYTIRTDMHKPFRVEVPCEFEIVYPDAAKTIRDQCANEIDDLVTKRTTFLDRGQPLYPSYYGKKVGEF